MEEDHSQSECEEFMKDFFKPTLSKVKEVEDLHGKHLAKARWPLYCPLTPVCMCMSHRQMDEAISAEFNSMVSSGSRCTPQVWPNQTSLVSGSRSSQLTLLRPGCNVLGRREDVAREMYQAGQSHSYTQWDKMSMTRRNWRVVGATCATMAIAQSQESSVWGVPSCEARGHVASSGRVATGQVHFVLDRTKSQAGEDHCEGFMKVFFKIELSKSRRSTCSSTRRWTGHAHGRDQVEGLAAKFKFFAVFVVDAEIVLHCVGRRDNVTGILYGRVILQLRWTQWLWL